MASNHQFSLAIHLLTALAYYGPGGSTSSELAEGMSTNPVVVRRLLSTLHRAGLVDCHPGKSGGCQLARPAERISLQDIYAAVEAPGPFSIPVKPENKTCAVSRHMKDILERIFNQTQSAIARSLTQTTVADLLKSVAEVV